MNRSSYASPASSGQKLSIARQPGARVELVALVNAFTPDLVDEPVLLAAWKDDAVTGICTT